MEQDVEIFVEICRDDVALPQYARPGDAGMDVRAACEVTLSPLTSAVIPTGLKVAIPEGYEIQVRPRSGLSLKTSLRIPNAPGTIDSGFRDEIGIIVYNASPTESLTVNKGDRVAQLVLQRVPTIKFVPVASVADIGTDRGGGFGSTGKE